MKNLIKKIINDAYLDIIIDGHVDKSPYDIRIKDNFNTACWIFKNNRHIIFIGDKILADTTKQEKIEHYISSYLYHEVSHSLETDRDLISINNMLNAYSIPFSLWNLAEDARIEELMRERTTRDFLWYKYEDLEKPISPVEILFHIVQNDGNYKEIEESKNLTKVVEFYDKFILSSSSAEVVEILIDWLVEFPSSKEDTQNLQDKLEAAQDKNGEPINSGTRALEDLRHSLSFQTSEKEFREAMRESVSLMDDKQAPSDQTDIELNTVSISSCSNAKVISNDIDDWDETKAKSLSENFLYAFSEKKRYKVTKKRSRNINKKAFKKGSYTNKLYRKQDAIRTTKKELIMILDCSGSMHGFPIDNMKIVIGVFNELVKIGHINAKIILSGVSNSNEAIHETFQMPLTYETIAKFSAKYNSEGIESAMKANQELLKSADNVFVLTDGNIWDEPIQKETYHLAGIYTVGIYIGSIECCNLNIWFDKGVAVERIEDCVDELVSHLKDV